MVFTLQFFGEFTHLVCMIGKRERATNYGLNNIPERRYEPRRLTSLNIHAPVLLSSKLIDYVQH
jgi:hypothetical protein